MKFSKILGTNNLADLFTKYLDEKVNKKHTIALAVHFRDGRAAEAPQLHEISQSLDEHFNGGNIGQWEWLQAVYCGSNRSNRCKRSEKQNEIVQNVNMLSSNCRGVEWRTWQRDGTSSRQQVLWVSKQRVPTDRIPPSLAVPRVRP